MRIELLAHACVLVLGCAVAAAQDVKIARKDGRATVAVTLEETPALAVVKQAKAAATGGAVDKPKISKAALTRIYKLAVLRQAIETLKTALYAEVASDEQVVKAVIEL